MPPRRISTKRVIGGAIDRAVREVEGSRTGHTYLRQHHIDPMTAWQRIGLRDRRFSDSEPPAGGDGGGGGGMGDVVDLTGVFMCEVTGLENPNERFAN